MIYNIEIIIFYEYFLVFQTRFSQFLIICNKSSYHLSPIPHFYYRPEITCSNSTDTVKLSLSKENSTTNVNFDSKSAFKLKLSVENPDEFECKQGCTKTTAKKSGDLVSVSCECSSLSDFSLSSISSVFGGSNLNKLANADILLQFDFANSPVFYLILSIFILTFFGVIWGFRKDKTNKSNLLMIPKGNHNFARKALVYLQILHPILSIYFIRNKKFTRVIRVLLFCMKLMGLLALSAVFKQSVQGEKSFISNAATSFVTVFTMMTIMSLMKIFFINIENKNSCLWFYKFRNYFGFFFLTLSYFGSIYIVLVISASNSQNGDELINVWVFEFFVTFSLDTFLIQPVKIIVQVSIYQIFIKSHKSRLSKFMNRDLKKVHKFFTEATSKKTENSDNISIGDTEDVDDAERARLKRKSRLSVKRQRPLKFNRDSKKNNQGDADSLQDNSNKNTTGGGKKEVQPLSRRSQLYKKK